MIFDNSLSHSLVTPLRLSCESYDSYGGFLLNFFGVCCHFLIDSSLKPSNDFVQTLLYFYVFSMTVKWRLFKGPFDSSVFLCDFILINFLGTSFCYLLDFVMWNILYHCSFKDLSYWFIWQIWKGSIGGYLNPDGFGFDYFRIKMVSLHLGELVP